jgi:cytochrome P450
LQGHLRDLAQSQLSLFQRCADLNEVTQFRVYWYTCHIVTDPVLAGEMLIERAADFKKTRALQAARPTFGNGLVTSEGEDWKRQQRLLRRFFTPRAVEGYDALMVEATSRQLDAWQDSSSVDLHEDMVDVSLEIACKGLFGIAAGDFKSAIREASHAVQHWHSACEELCLPYPHYWPSLANLRYRLATRTLNRQVYKLIRRARQVGGSDFGLLSAMLTVKDDDGRGISDRELRDQIVTLFLAGHDTTASSAAFGLYELSHRPDLQERIVSELEQGGESECLSAVIEETLRLYPSVHLVARTALSDVRLGRYLIRRGEEVVVPLWVMQRSAESFDAPHDFLPERWKAQKKSNRPASLPFSAGPRVCTGKSLALHELRTILGHVVRRFRLLPVGERSPRIEARMTLYPAPGSTVVRIERRLQAHPRRLVDRE